MSSLFGGGGGNKQNAAQQVQTVQAQIQQEQQMRNLQGQTLRNLSLQQAQSDQEAAALSRPGLGRQLLAFAQKKETGASLGG